MTQPNYGFAYCPCCQTEIDLSKNQKFFTRNFENATAKCEMIYFYLCDSCFNKFEKSTIDEKNHIAAKAFNLVKKSPNGFQASVSLSSLIVNDFDVVNAFENGTNLPKSIVQLFQDGTISKNDFYALSKLFNSEISARDE